MLLLSLLGALTACNAKKAGTPSGVTAGQEGSPTEYLLDSQPFSPSLPYLFDQGRLVVLPTEVIGEPPPGTPLEGYAFSAVDRFGHIYHFDPIGRWYMDEGDILPEPLPPDEWDLAWNPAAGSLEVLVTAPWAGQSNVQLLRLRAGRWTRVELKDPPIARTGASRLFQRSRNSWIVAGGRTDNQSLAEGWILRGEAWKKWDVVRENGPDLTQIWAIVARQGSDALAVLTRPGVLWFWTGRAWTSAGSVRMEDLMLVTYDPHLDRILFVWSGGPGQDHFLWHPFKKTDSEAAIFPQPISQTALVRINEEEEGVWKDWGRVRATTGPQGKPQTVYQPGMGGTGEPAVRISAEYGDAIFRRSQIQCIEMPPRLDSLRPHEAVYVPALGGILVPSVAGLGIDAQHKAFFPVLANDPATKPTSGTAPANAAPPTLDVIQKFYRLWVFKEHNIDWIKPPYEIHPGIDYPNSYQTTDGRRRCLSWWFPEPGLLRYEFYEFQDQKVEWVHSPLLTLRTIPQLQLAPDEDIYVCEPVVWGDPAELIVIGWAGKLNGQRTFDKSPNGLADEAYANVPTRGFMARLSALTPDQWTISTHDIPFNMGAQLVAAPGQNSLYLLGGKMAEAHTYGGQTLQFMVSNTAVWRWAGSNWQRLDPSGIEPRMKTTSHITYDPIGNQLLSLTPRALYGFDSQSWHSLWQRQKRRGEQWPDDVGLFIHPLSHTILGAWFTPEPTMQVWRQDHWVPVRYLGPQPKPANTPTSSTQAEATPLPAGGPLPNVTENLLPSTVPDCFISVDANRLAAIRMDARREREQDRLLGAHWLTLRPANQGPPAFSRSKLPTVPASQAEPTTATVGGMVASDDDAATTTAAQDAVSTAPAGKSAVIGGMRASEPNTASVVVPTGPPANAPSQSTSRTTATVTIPVTTATTPTKAAAPAPATTTTAQTTATTATTATMPASAAKATTPTTVRSGVPAKDEAKDAPKVKQAGAKDDQDDDDQPRHKRRIHHRRAPRSDDDEDAKDNVEIKKSNARKKVLNDD